MSRRGFAYAWRAAEDRLVCALRMRLSPGLLFRLFGVVDRMGSWPQEIVAGPAAGFHLVGPFSRRSSYCAGRHEPEVAALLSRLMPPGGTAVDIGSHLGYFTLVLARMAGAGGHVFSFEPLPEHAELVRRSIAYNDLRSVSVVEQAVGDRVGEAWLSVHPYGALTAVSQAGEHVRRVQLTTLDQWRQNGAPLQRLDLLKIDTEGHELPVLRGAEQTLAHFRPSLVCELHFRANGADDPEQVTSWLRAAGYRVYGVPRRLDLDQAFAWCRRRAARRREMVVLHIAAVPDERPDLLPD